MNRGLIMGKLPAPGSGSVLIEKDQSVFDIMSLIKYVHKKNLSNYDRIAGMFWKGNVYDTCEALWKFCKNNIRYSIETDKVQTVRSPQRILSEVFGDCKHYASFIGGVLGALQRQGYKIDWKYRFASYRLFDSTPGHVFVVVNDGEEIWIDPVLNSFDEHKPYMYAQDRKISNAMLGCNCNSGKIGSVGASYGWANRANAAYGYENTMGSLKEDFTIGGNGLLSVAPALAVIPVIGWIGGAIIGAVGGIMRLVGGLLNDYKTSTQVRWLDQLFEYYVQGNTNSTSDHHVNETNVPAAHAWFYTVLGIPMYDRIRFNALKGLGGKSKAQAVADYYAAAPDAKNVPPDAVAHAYDIAQTMKFTDPPGGWRDMHAANVYPTMLVPPQLTNVNVNQPTPNNMFTNSILPMSQGTPAVPSKISWPVILLAGGALYFITRKK